MAEYTVYTVLCEGQLLWQLSPEAEREELAREMLDCSTQCASTAW